MGLDAIPRSVWRAYVNADPQTREVIAAGLSLQPSYLDRMAQVQQALDRQPDAETEPSPAQVAALLNSRTQPAPVVSLADIHLPDPQPPTYTDYPVIHADSAIVVSDLHAPHYHPGLLYAALALALEYRVEQFIILGDLLDAGQPGLSPWPELWEQDSAPSLLTVLETVKDVLLQIRRTGCHVTVLHGNHDARIARASLGAIHLGMLLSGDGVAVSRYHHARLSTRRGEYWLVHPKSASRVTLSVADKLREKLSPQGSVVMGHTHRLGMGRSKDGRDWLIEIGGCFRPETFQYPNVELSTFPAMTPGFLMIRDGYPYLFDERPDWSFWLPTQHQALEARLQAA